jgi:hypothetical protein
MWIVTLKRLTIQPICEGSTNRFEADVHVHYRQTSTTLVGSRVLALEDDFLNVPVGNAVETTNCVYVSIY